MKINVESFKAIKRKWIGRGGTSGLLGKIIVYLLLIGISYVFLYPLLKMISMSFLSMSDLVDPEVDWIPKSLSFYNYVVVERVLRLLPPSFAEFFKNPGNLIKTLTTISTFAIFQTIVSALTGYAFARYNFKFKKFWFVMVLVSFIIPLPMVTIPRIILISNLQDSIWIPFAQNFQGTGLEETIPRTLFQSNIPQFLFTFFGQGVNSAILILIFYNFFKMIPISLDEAARMDGATSFQVFWHVYIKLVTPIIITVFLFSFVWNWNDTYTPSVFYSTNNPSVTMILSYFDFQFANRAGTIPGQGGEARINEAYKMAATFLSMLPLFILYIFAQRKFIEGIERTGLTGE